MACNENLSAGTGKQSRDIGRHIVNRRSCMITNISIRKIINRLKTVMFCTDLKTWKEEILNIYGMKRMGYSNKEVNLDVYHCKTTVYKKMERTNKEVNLDV